MTPRKATGRPASTASLRRLDEKLRRMAAAKTDGDVFLTRARRALRVQKLRQRAERLLNPDAVMHREVERASARRELARDLRAAGWWYRLTGERTDDIL